MRRKFLFGAMATLGLLAGCTPPEPGGFSLNPNAVVLPEAEVDSVAANEMYVQTDKELKSGQLVVSDEGDGLVRRITEATTIQSRQVGAQIVRKVYLKTEEASLEEAVVAGDARLDFGELQIGEDSLVQALPGVSVQAVTGRINITNVTFSPAQGVNITLNGFVQQKLSPKFRLVINQAAGSDVSSVDVFEAALDGSLTASLQARIVADKKFSLAAGTEQPIAQFAPLRQAFSVGVVPVVVVVTPRLVVGASGGADSQVTIQAGIQPTLSVNAGVRYDRDGAQKWVGVWTPPSFNLNPSFSYTVPSNGNGQLYAKMVLDVKFYGVAGPTLEAKPYVGLTFNPSPATATVRAGLGASAAVSAGFKVLGKGLELGTSPLSYDASKDYSCSASRCQ